MEKKDIKVTITVPVYNTSRYLTKCLDSLINQTLNDIEIIIVDDGSTDSSGHICDQYATKDSRITVIHQQNSGLAVARQIGLESASGDYVIVCDSDDWVELDMYEKLYEIAKRTDADIVCCDYYTEYNDGRSIPITKKFKTYNGDIVDNIDYTYHGACNSWVQLVKRDFIVKNNITYVPGINLGEDAFITLKIMKFNPLVIKTNENLYHYRRLFGENTYTNNIKNTQIQQLYYKYDWIKKNYDFHEYDEMIFSYALSIIFSSLRAKDKIDIKQFNQFLSSEITWKKLIASKKTLKSVVAVSAKILPYRLLKLILRLLYPFFYK